MSLRKEHMHTIASGFYEASSFLLMLIITVIV